jgi:hypothetical protein
VTLRQKIVVLGLVAVFLGILFAEKALAQTTPEARAPQSVHRAEIKITKTTVTAKHNIKVTTKITGLSRAGAHWRLLWTKKGTKQKARNQKRVRGNRRGKTVATRRLAPGRHIVTALIVGANGKPFKASQFPGATLTAKKTVRVRKGACQIAGVPRSGVIRGFQAQDFSQVLGTLSVHAQRGAEIALEVIAARGGIAGCELRVDFVDDPFDGDPAQCLQKYRKAIKSGKYDFYIGPSGSACMVALPDITKAAGQFLVLGPSANPQPYQENYKAQGPYIMNPGVPSFVEGRTMAQWAIDNGFKRTAVMVPNYPYGQEVGRAFVSYFGASRVVAQQFPEFNEENLTPFINALVAGRFGYGHGS